MAMTRRNSVLLSTFVSGQKMTVKSLSVPSFHVFADSLAPYEKSKFLGSGGSMVARLKLKGIDGRAPPGVEPAA
ncbi:hypothetical protein Bca52824_073122 [Brassica carinata]|uniref:Uncharacterized protein n=1 Tax=Brassica carinata TaxID=52824 RepID=A0A8X7QDF8_BRACI|nr:hypothetical protein Bca52824_073122 [Brassica carinata]